MTRAGTTYVMHLDTPVARPPSQGRAEGEEEEVEDGPVEDGVGGDELVVEDEEGEGGVLLGHRRRVGEDGEAGVGEGDAAREPSVEGVVGDLEDVHLKSPFVSPAIRGWWSQVGGLEGGRRRWQ